jgi:hypothetical protein
MHPTVLEVVERVVIAGGPGPRSRALTGVQLLPNGDLLVGYRDGSDHLVTDDGVVMTVRSTDGGRSWQEPRTVVTIPGWDCAGGRSIVQTPGGGLLMFVFQARRSHTPEVRVYSIKSSDEGHTWGPNGPELSIFSGWTEPNTSGRMLVLSDGRWMIPAYGADSTSGISNPTGSASDGSTSYSIVAFSDDHGESWSETSTVARDPAINFHELSVTRIENGKFLAVIRTQDPPFTSYRSHSDDEGRTWSTPKPLPFAGQTPFLLVLPSGAICCVYRDRHPDRPGVSASLSNDGGETWMFAGQLYEGTDWNCGYPGLVALPNGELFCAYYSCYDNAGNSEVHGLFLRETS